MSNKPTKPGIYLWRRNDLHKYRPKVVYKNRYNVLKFDWNGQARTVDYCGEWADVEAGQ